MTATTATQTCATCQQENPLTAFSSRSNGKGGRFPRSHCRDCENATNRNNTAARARHNARRRAARAEIRANIVTEAWDMVPDYKLREEWTFLHSIGVSDEHIAHQLGYNKTDSLHKALRRAGILPPVPEEAAQSR